MTKDEILPKLRNLKVTHNGWTALCPAHDDHKRSLSISEKDGKVLLNCFVECTYGDILAALGVSMSSNGNNSNRKEVAVYDYTDEKGELIYQNVRFEPKGFGQRRKNKDGRNVWNLNGMRRVPYRLPQLVNLTALQDVVMAEGEKDADTLTKLGFSATSHKNWRKEFNYLLKGRKVVIFQDHDRAGVEQAEKTAKLIYRDAEAVKVVDCFADEPLPEKHGKDVSDYLESHSLEELRELIKNTPNYSIAAESGTDEKSNGLKVVCLADVEAEEIFWLWKPFIAIGEFTIIEGIEGLGKSWACCALACAVADGRKLPFSESEPVEPCNVLMLSAEDSLSHTIKPRLVGMNANLERIFALDEVFSLDNPNDLIRFEAEIIKYEPKLIIIDPIFSYTGGKNLNAESDSRPIARKLIAIAQKYNCAIIGVRHIGKAKGNGDARAAGLGSIAWRASARSVLIIGQDEETGEKAICQTKNNLCEQSKIAVGFEIENGKFYWKSEPSRLTKEKMLAQPKDDESKAEQTEAVEFLREVLKSGERPSKEIEKEAKEIGITIYALRKARTILGIKSEKKGGNFGGDNAWYLRLPNTEIEKNATEDADTEGVQHLQSNQSDKTIYSNDLAEDVEPPKNRHLQPPPATSSTSSNGAVPIWKPKEVCKCGTEGMLGEKCQNCGEPIIPF